MCATVLLDITFIQDLHRSTAERPPNLRHFIFVSKFDDGFMAFEDFYHVVEMFFRPEELLQLSFGDAHFARVGLVFH